MELQNWDRTARVKVNPLLERQMIHSPQMTILQLRYQKGAIVPLHHHIHEQITMVTSGALLFQLSGQVLTLKAGDVLHVPSNAPHSAEALEDSFATEVFTPAREDLANAG